VGSNKKYRKQQKKPLGSFFPNGKPILVNFKLTDAFQGVEIG
jgi:hypothetical protein